MCSNRTSVIVNTLSECEDGLQKLRYSEHNWAICIDFKMVNFLLGRQGGTPNIPVFSVIGAVALLISTGSRRIDRHEKILQ